jgi:hypothetical protein
MPHLKTKKCVRVVALLAVVLAGLALAACGSSAKTSSTTSASASSTTTRDPAGAGGTRLKALRECLQKHGITLPTPKPGQGWPGSRFFGGPEGPKFPAGVTRAQYEAAIKACGGFPGRGGFLGRGGRLSSPAAQQALTKFADCMRENGINLPTPNTSGKGPIFNTSGLDTASAKFREAEAKCRTQLRGAFPGRAGSSAPPGAVG